MSKLRSEISISLDGYAGPLVEESQSGVGAVIMGRNMFGGGPGPWGEDPWPGWWGEEPPFHGLNMAPILLGDGTRLFDDGAGAGLDLEPILVVDTPDVTHLRYRLG